MKVEIAAFVMGILVNSVKHGIETSIGQKLGDWLLGKLAEIPRVLHYVYKHEGWFHDCPQCVSKHQVDTLTG